MLYNTCTRKKNLFRESIKMKIFLLFTIIFPKIDMNVVKTISSNLLTYIREKKRFPLAKAAAIAEC